MSYLPTFLSFSLPTISLPAISLPVNIQRRFLSFLLKRTLGHLVKPGQLDIGQIEAQIGDGRVEIKELELDQEAINGLLADLPVQLRDGKIDKISAQIPLPNLFSAPFSLSLASLQLSFTLRPAQSTVPPPPYVDLAASVTSVAETFVHDELSQRETKALHESLATEAALLPEEPIDIEERFPPGSMNPFLDEEDRPVRLSAAETGEMEGVSIFATLLERLLLRFSFRATDTRIRLIHPNVAEYVLTIPEVTFAMEGGAEESMVATRTVKMVGLDVSVRPLLAQHTSNDLNSPVTDDFPSAPISSSDEDTPMSMSQSIVSLPRSSMYHSTASTVQHSLQHSPTAIPSSPIQSTNQQNDSLVVIFSLSSEPIVIRVGNANRQPIVPSLASADTGPDVENPETLEEPSNSDSDGKRVSRIYVDISVGALAVGVTEYHMQTLAATVSFALPPPDSRNSSSLPEKNLLTTRNSRAGLVDMRMKMKGVVILLLQSPEINDELEDFFHRPLSSPLHRPHIRIHLETLEATACDSITTSATTTPTGQTARLSLSDLSIFAISRSATLVNPDSWVAKPILISDTNLPYQYDPNAASFPIFEISDWRKAESLSVRPSLWRARIPSHNKRKPPLAVGPVAPACHFDMTTDPSGSNSAKLVVQPIHVFLDLAAIGDLLTSMTPMDSNPQGYFADSPRTDMYGPETQEAKKRRKSQGTGVKNPISKPSTFLVHFSMVRLQVRAPPSPAWDRAEMTTIVRSGSFVLDAHDLQLASGNSLQARTPARFIVRDATHGEGTGKTLLGQVEWRRIFLSFAGPQEPRASSFTSLGPLSISDAEQTVVEKPVLPLVNVRSVSSAQPAGGESKSVEICIPSAQVMLDKATVDGLQIFGDDCSQWVDGTFGEGRLQSGANTRNPSLIGSRYFAKPPSSLANSKAGSVRTHAVGHGTTKPTEFVVSLAIAESALRLLLTRGGSDGPLDVHPLTMWTSDLEVLAEIKSQGKNENVISVIIADAKVASSSATGVDTTLLEVTPPFRQAVKSRPMIEIRIKSATDPDTLARESSISLTAARFTYTLTTDLSWIEDISIFLKAPPGVFEAVVPNERTRLLLKVYDGSLQVLGPTHKGGLVVTMNDLSLSTEFISDLPDIAIQLQLRSLHALFLDNITAVSQLSSSTGKRSSTSAADIWQNLGYVPVADVSDLDMNTIRTLPSSNDVRIDRVKVAMHLCADTMSAIGDFGKDVGSVFESKQKAPEPRAKVDSIPFTHKPKRDLLASLEEDAFNLPDVGLTGDMIYDDLPTNPDYLDSAYGASGGVDVLPEEAFEELSNGERSPGPETPIPGTPENIGVLSNIGGETIRVLDESGLKIIDDYLDTVTPVDDVIFGIINNDVSMRIRIKECDFKVHLHDGYDWEVTRKAIDEEIRAMRRRLLKIRQLLASGQAPDQSVEETHAWLFNSVHIGLTEVDEDMEPAAIIAAIDKELDDELETASQSSWQSLNPPPSTGKTPTSPRSAGGHPARGRKKKLTRSRHSRIDVCIYGLQGEVDNFRPHDSDIVSRVLVDIRDLEILDHIKTSTWKKFLSEMKSDSKGNVRETGSNMARIELRMVRPSKTLDNEEARLKIKVLPIRLHVDQDALDFLKAFGSFSNPQAPVPSELPTAPPPPEIFFQHVEVFPVALKLDYKPKRVDYKALKEGKTIELMNFFHFDGAEMTLRHITLSGLTGWATLGETLNDLWTPDVKANQMVDIISGIAPIRSIVNVGSGFADLILLPISQYKKDGRIIRGVQKGAKSFFKTSAIEAVTVVGRIATGTQVILEAAEDALGGNTERRMGSVVSDSIDDEYLGSPRLRARQSLSLSDNESDNGEMSQSVIAGFSGDNAISRYADQPIDIKQGVKAGYKSLGKNLNEAAQTILAVPMEVYERSGNEGPMKKVIRAVPIAVLKPMIGASEAVSKTFLGLRNTMDPQNRRENEEKYKR